MITERPMIAAPLNAALENSHRVTPETAVVLPRPTWITPVNNIDIGTVLIVPPSYPPHEGKLFGILKCQKGQRNGGTYTLPTSIPFQDRMDLREGKTYKHISICQFSIHPDTGVLQFVPSSDMHIQISHMTVDTAGRLRVPNSEDVFTIDEFKSHFPFFRLP